MKSKPAARQRWRIYDYYLAIGTVTLMLYFAIAAGAAAWLLDEAPVSAANSPPVSSVRH